jgi:hypothetical protein
LAIYFFDVAELIFSVLWLSWAKHAPVNVKVVVAEFRWSKRRLGYPVWVVLAGLGVSEYSDVADHVGLRLQSKACFGFYAVNVEVKARWLVGLKSHHA